MQSKQWLSVVKRMAPYKEVVVLVYNKASLGNWG